MSVCAPGVSGFEKGTTRNHFLLLIHAVLSRSLGPHFSLSLSQDSECGLELVLLVLTRPVLSLTEAAAAEPTCGMGAAATEGRRGRLVRRRRRDESLLSSCYFHDVRKRGNQFLRENQLESEDSGKETSAPLFPAAAYAHTHARLIEKM